MLKIINHDIRSAIITVKIEIIVAGEVLCIVSLYRVYRCIGLIVVRNFIFPRFLLHWGSFEAKMYRFVYIFR